MSQWLDSLRRIAENPSQNATAIAAGIAIVVVFSIILVLLLIAFALPGRSSSPKHGPSSGAKRPRWLSWLAGASITLVGALVAVSLWYAGTSSNDYCTRTCHAMAGALDTWSLSAHSSVDCTRCHEGRRWRSLPRGVVMRGLCLYAQVSGESPRGMSVPPSNCMQCHINVISKPVVARNGETFLHGEALTQNEHCTRCHGAQGHEMARP